MEMLPERVFDPYAKSFSRAELAQQAIEKIHNGGQGDTNRTSTAPVDPKAPEPSVTLSPQVTALARKEQKIRQQEKILKDRETAMEAQRAKLAKLEALEQKLAKKDYSGLDELVDYNEYSNYQVNKLNGADPNQEALKKVQDELVSLKKSQEENISKQFEAAVNDRREAAKKHIASDEKLTGIAKKLPELKIEEAVVQHILDTWEHDSKELSVEDATKEVQEVILERAKKWASILDEEPKPTEAPADLKKQLPPLKQEIKTLTNQVTSTELGGPKKPLYFMSDSERWAEARRRATEKIGLR
jgi:hypothetical protein